MKRAVLWTAVLPLLAVLAYLPKASAQNPRSTGNDSSDSGSRRGCPTWLCRNTHFTTIDFPGAGLTVANGVNENGEIVGFYRTALQSPAGALAQPLGFLLSNGKFLTIQVPGAALTRAFGINNFGDIVGDYVMAGVNYGFLLRDGSNLLKAGSQLQFQTIRYTNGNFATAFTDSWGVDEEGNVTGGFNDADGMRKAYVWRDNIFAKVMLAPFPTTFFTYTHGTNAKGEIVGCYFDRPDPSTPSNTVMHSLRITAEGDYKNEDFPGSMMSMYWRITDSSIMVGHYVDMDGVEHGYICKDGEYETIDFPGAILTEAHGIAEIEQFNRHGQSLGTRGLLIVGPYVDSNNVRHGFLFTP